MVCNAQQSSASPNCLGVAPTSKKTSRLDGMPVQSSVSITGTRGYGKLCSYRRDLDGSLTRAAEQNKGARCGVARAGDGRWPARPAVGHKPVQGHEVEVDRALPGRSRAGGNGRARRAEHVLL